MAGLRPIGGVIVTVVIRQCAVDEAGIQRLRAPWHPLWLPSFGAPCNAVCEAAIAGSLPMVYQGSPGVRTRSKLHSRSIRGTTGVYCCGTPAACLVVAILLRVWTRQFDSAERGLQGYAHTSESCNGSSRAPEQQLADAVWAAAARDRREPGHLQRISGKAEPDVSPCIPSLVHHRRHWCINTHQCLPCCRGVAFSWTWMGHLMARM